MKPMHLPGIEGHDDPGPTGERIRAMQAAGMAVPQILHLIAFRPAMTTHLARLTQEVMRGPSALSAGTRELIAAFTSSRNRCLF
jgi:alkylhydroperoxidase family enzyme